MYLQVNTVYNKNNSLKLDKELLEPDDSEDSFFLSAPFLLDISFKSSANFLLFPDCSDLPTIFSFLFAAFFADFNACFRCVVALVIGLCGLNVFLTCKDVASLFLGWVSNEVRYLFLERQRVSLDRHFSTDLKRLPFSVLFLFGVVGITLSVRSPADLRFLVPLLLELLAIPLQSLSLLPFCCANVNFF